MTTDPALIPVLDIADDLGADVPASHRDEAALRARLLAITLDAGEEWHADELDGLDAVHGRVSSLLVARGVLVAHVSLAGRDASQLLGPGDVFSPAVEEDELLPFVRSFVVAEDAVIAVVDDRLLAVSQRWPWIANRLLEGAARQLERAAVQQAISQLSRVELRLLALMWHASRRWGKVTSDGVAVSLNLTHAALGQLVGAKRPTVSLALKWLTEEGLISRRPGGDWLLAAKSSELLAASGAPLRFNKPPPPREPRVPATFRRADVDMVALADRFEELRAGQRATAERTAALFEQVKADREMHAGGGPPPRIDRFGSSPARAG